MSQTLVIRTPEEVSKTTRAFPKQGVFNLKITKNGAFDTVEFWTRCGASNITLELEGASFQSTSYVDYSRVIPETPMDISGSTFTLMQNIVQYIKIKLNRGVSVAYLRCSYAAKSPNTLIIGGNVNGQAFVDYGRKPYISTSLERMFTKYHVRSDITKWDIFPVTSLRVMFGKNISFNQAIGNWDVSNVIDMAHMFSGATAFNQPIGNWNVGNVTDMFRMFLGATSLNQDLSNWDVSSVRSMNRMFLGATSFNQDISSWDVSNVVEMIRMFYGATSFDQDLSSWAAKFHVNVDLDGLFGMTSWSTSNYDKFLNALWTDINTTRPEAWATRITPRLLGMGSSKYSAASAVARDSLVSVGWTITDGGLAE